MTQNNNVLSERMLLAAHSVKAQRSESLSENVSTWLKKCHTGLFSVALATLFIQASPTFAAAEAPLLGAAGAYTVLGTNTTSTSGTVTCTNTGPGSTITGNVGSTFNSITNTGCSIVGTVDAPVAGTVQTDFNNAFSALDSQNPTCDGVIPTTSTILPPGVYCSDAATVIGTGVTFTLDGSASDVWVFKVGTGGGGSLTGTGFSVVMGGSALACNVYWHTAEAATLTDSNFAGTVLSGTAITMTRGSWSGRALAGTDVTVTDADSMTFAGCSPPTDITVNKDFAPDTIESVPISLSCSSGTVSLTPLDAAEGSPAVFTVGGADVSGTVCTATETVPPGYTANEENCVDVALGGSCTIINTLSSNAVVVNKDFSPDSNATVSVDLTCTSGTPETSPLQASEANPAVFTVNDASPGATCTATETVPNGYTADESNCVDVSLGSSCTITNTVNSDTIVVNKDFSPDSTDSVPVALTCTSGEPIATPLDASESSPAVFTVTGASPGATCTATETVPVGYTADQTNCVDVTLGSSCVITNQQDNLPGRATFLVTKDFTDGNPMNVEVSISCNTGLVLDQSTEINQSEEVEFVIVSFDEGELNCTVSETLAPGYSPAYTASATTGLGLFSQDLQGCHFDEVVSGQFVCSIVNAPDLVDIEIEKLWVIDGAVGQEVDTSYSLSLYCDEPIGLVDRFEGDNSDTYFAQVAPQYPSSSCWVVETVYSSGVEIDNGCEDLVISAATGGDSCLITNTVFFEGIPALGTYGMAILSLLMLGIGFVGFRRFV